MKGSACLYWKPQPVAALFFSNVNDALSDYLARASIAANCACTPLNMTRKKTRRGERLAGRLCTDPAQEYCRSKISHRLEVILAEINDFFDHKYLYLSSIESLQYLSNKAKIRALEARINRMENSKGWKLLERFRPVYAGLLKIFKPSR